MINKPQKFIKKQVDQEYNNIEVLVQRGRGEVKDKMYINS